MRVSIYIAVRGGTVQGVRCGIERQASHLRRNKIECFVVDYDNYEHDAPAAKSEEDWERTQMSGKTWEEISVHTLGVY